MATRKSKAELTATRLRELLSYDPETGIFRWKTIRRGQPRVGSVAGRLAKNGYWEICVDGTLYGAHRLAWLYVHGRWPPADGEHKDTVRHNNRISNLREATRSQNLGNARKQANASGYKGVFWSKTAKRWTAQICIQYRRIHLGYFDRAQDAHAAYAEKARELFGQFARAR